MPGFLEPAGVGFLTAPEDFGDDFVGSVSGAFCLGPVLFGAEGDCLEEDVEALTLGLDSGMAFVVFFVVAGLDISFSTSFLGEAGFLELWAEPGLDEARFSDTVLLLFGSERDAGTPGTARLVVVGLVLVDLLVGLLVLSVSGF